MTQAASTGSEIAVPLLDLKGQFAALKDEIMPRMEEVFDSQYFINGPAVKELEEAVAAYCECESGGAVGVSSGTDALVCALMALGIGPGDEVVTTPFTFFATVGSIARVGAKPVFVDIDPVTFNIDAAGIGSVITEKTKAIIPVHLFGQVADMDAVNDVAGRHGLAVIEDAAQAIGSTYKGRKAGSLGTVGCFSFFPSKNLGGAGDGGIITTTDAELRERLAVFRNHGGQPKYYHQHVGGNFRLDTLQAAYLLVKLKCLDGWHEGRRRNAAVYDAGLADVSQVATPRILEENETIYNQYCIRAENRDGLREHLGKRKIGSEIYYPLCLHEQECFADLGYSKGDFPEAERAASEVLAVPIYPELTEEQLNHVIVSIREFYA